MEPIKHPDANRVLGPPRDWNEAENGPCETLHVFATVQGDNVVIQSAWMPSAEELAALNAGQPLILMVYGTVIPPMAVGVLEPKEAPPSEREQADADATLFGRGYMVDDKRVHPSRIKIVHLAGHDTELEDAEPQCVKVLLQSQGDQCLFVECHDENERGVSVPWHERSDGLHELRLWMRNNPCKAKFDFGDPS